MAKYLLLGTTSEPWRLPADADADEIRDDITAAHRAGISIEVAVEMQDNPLEGARLVINPAQLGYWTVFEQGE